MKHRRFIVNNMLWFVFAGILSLSGTLSAEEISVYTCQVPPLNFAEHGDTRDAKGDEVTGFATDVVREILKRTNQNTTIRLFPWARAYKYAQEERNVFLFSMARTSDRENMFKWVGPIARKKTILFAKKESTLKITSLNDAKQVGSIGVMREDSKEQYLKKNGFTNIDSTTTWDQSLKKLLTDRNALWINTDLDAPAIAKEAGLDINGIKPAYTMHEYDMYIGVSKTTSDELVGQWQKALDEIKQDGTFQRIMTQWAAYYHASNWVIKDGMFQVQYE